MRKVWAASALTLAVTALALTSLVGSAAATPPQSATLVVMRNGNLEEIGWYASFPGFSDGGSVWTSDFRAFGGGKSPVFAGLLKSTEIGARGTFQTNWQVLDNMGTFSGTCELSGGTDSYKGLHGTGSWTFHEQGGTRFYTCAAAVHFD
jgi:opacity protein-like surface antigen